MLPIDIPDLHPADDGADAAGLRSRLQSTLTRQAGVVRSGESLLAAGAEVSRIAGTLARSAHGSTGHLELRNLVEVGAALVHAAASRIESRGCHTRSDAPDPSEDMLLRLVVGGPPIDT